MNVRTIAPFAGALLMSTGLLVAQTTQTTVPPLPTAQAQDPKTPDITVTGCLIQGSAPTVFLLDNARVSTDDPSKPGKTYVLVGATEDIDFRQQVNDEVTATGMPDGKVAPVPPVGEKVAEKDLPRFSAKSVMMLSDKCLGATR